MPPGDSDRVLKSQFLCVRIGGTPPLKKALRKYEIPEGEAGEDVRRKTTKTHIFPLED